MTVLRLDDQLQQCWKNQDVFALVKTIEGQVYKEKDNRRVIRFESTGRPLFLKIHRGVGWKEIIKNLLQRRIPVIGATNEWRALNYLKAVGIDTMTPVGYGKTGINPANQLSFLITEELGHSTTLETFCANWAMTPPAFGLRLALIKKLASIARTMHERGINHRDFYLCHFLLDIEQLSAKTIRLFLVDLHRAQIRSKVPKRWLIKDLGSLYFSALGIGLSPRDVLRFIRHYSHHNLRWELEQNAAFWNLVNRRAIALNRKAIRKNIAPPGNREKA